MYYHFTTNSQLAWRISGQAARLAIEMGLTHSFTYDQYFPTPESRMMRCRCSGSSSCSIACAASVAVFPMPSQRTTLTLLCQKSVARMIPRNSPEWSPSKQKSVNEAGGSLQFAARAFLYIRKNTIKLIIYRPVFDKFKTSPADVPSDLLRAAVDVVKDTISALSLVHANAEAYKNQQLAIYHSLMTSMNILLLAVAYGSEKMSAYCRDDFYAALEMARELSPGTLAGKGLQRIVRTLSGDTASNAQMGNVTLRQAMQAQRNPHMLATSSTMAEGGASMTGQLATLFDSFVSAATPVQKMWTLAPACGDVLVVRDAAERPAILVVLCSL
ncbi:hypothetical protein MRB53_039553 [Persea americana]|nr:hypothetical protein MRB53_039553 [Persea americana]